MASNLVTGAFIWLLLNTGCIAMDANAKGPYCVGMCGNWTHLPCACHAKCLAYKNCCMDFNETCPEEHSAGLDRFGFLSDRQVSCNVEGVFTVSSCRRREEYDFFLGTTHPPMLKSFLDGIQDSMYVSTTESPFIVNRPEYESTTKPAKDESVTLEMLLKHRPVYDTATGILFSNYDKYLCNSVENSQPVFWEIKLGVDSIIVDWQTLESIQSVISWKTVRYIQPASLGPDRVGVTCIPQSITRCPEKEKYESPDVYHLCKSYITYVSITADSEQTFYNNANCADCWSKERTSSLEIFGYEPTEFDSPFSLLVAMSYLNDRVIIKQSEGPTRDTQIAWKEISCGIEDETKPSVKSCDNVVCDVDAVWTADKQCVKGKFLKVAVGASKFGVNVLNSLKEAALNKLVVCWFQDIFRHGEVTEIEDGVSAETTVYFDEVVNETLYETTVVLVDTVDTQFITRPGYIRNLDFLNKALAWYVNGWSYDNFQVSMRAGNQMDYSRSASGPFPSFRSNGTTANVSHSWFPGHNSSEASQPTVQDGRNTTGAPSRTGNESWSSEDSAASGKTQLLQDALPDLSSINFDRRTVVNDSVQYTTCVCQHGKGDTCRQVCWQTTLYLGDVNMIREYQASPCFAMLLQSSGCNLHPPTFFLFLLPCAGFVSRLI